MSKKYLVAVLLIGFLALSFNGVSSAQATKKEADTTDYSYGAVVKVSSSQLVVAEYDFEKDQEVNATYELDPKVELKNVKSIGEIAQGDSVDITYFIKNGKKIATIIEVAKPVEERTAPFGE